MNIIEVKNIVKTYQDKKNSICALDGVSLTIKRGEIFGLLGVNGAGKTTLSSILAALHPATSGTVLFENKSIYDHLTHYKRSIGFCPQQQNLDEFLTVEENLLFAGRYFLIPEHEVQQRTKELLHEFQLTQHADAQTESLSGGNKQRLLIARALIHKPKIIILDEPTVGLDPDIRRKLWLHIKKLKENGVTIILTTHYLDEAEFLSDRICILEKGKIIALESLDAIKKAHNMDSLENIFITLTTRAIE